MKTQRRVKLPRQRKVVRQQLGLGFDRERKVVLEDVVGTALGSTVDWCHLNIPMEYEVRSYVNGWRAGSVPNPPNT